MATEIGSPLYSSWAVPGDAPHLKNSLFISFVLTSSVCCAGMQSTWKNVLEVAYNMQYCHGCCYCPIQPWLVNISTIKICIHGNMTDINSRRDGVY